ncbi:hypothetical protein C488_13318 [Natrinema pellirubrum DSM 15624]|uniref:C2H2-type domain-containing protein n=1 Tax=Natrinema pellirubrum (strain DSM 15624 / CIP 106293 / JCM 10476 / NCIMB 786 / 157) TaxID=797303 RepID=L0JN07_NATP1|nr:hypothetical protein [Natrinema pellirubrum]AGB32649.1 hypothetical protein Natpe_2851 [Natrinema pellirubrum DSM 15624]ELY73784.1 hypothetical protein C488_13318 [Natrinema pellirubrum DSM 15624]
MSGDSSDHAPTGASSTRGATTGTEPAVDAPEGGKDGDPPARCPYCGRPFRRVRYERLHRGRAHPARLSDRERAALERARRAESKTMRRVRLYAVGAVVVIYFGLLIVAAFVV